MKIQIIYLQFAVFKSQTKHSEFTYLKNLFLKCEYYVEQMKQKYCL